MPAVATPKTCPNCKQEGLYLRSYITKNGKVGVRLFSPVSGLPHTCKDGSREPACSKCQKLGLKWSKAYGGNWQLSEQNGTKHICNAVEIPAEAQPADVPSPEPEPFPEPTKARIEQDWLLHVWNLRKRAAELQLRYVFGTRRIMQGAKMLSSGKFTWKQTEDATVYFGMPEDDKRKLLSDIKVPYWPEFTPSHVDVADSHKQTATLVELLRLRQHVLMVGPAGSGKTHAAEQAAEALSLPFYPLSVGPQTSKSDLLGYTNGMNGSLVRTVLREAYEHGGVFLLDEVDAGNAGVLTVLNALLANNVCSFPDGVIKKHADFVCCAGANTFGTGANRLYVGRNQLDAATLDRFVGINWDYDETLEERIVTGMMS